MQKPFDDLHASLESQLGDAPLNLPDSEAVAKARALSVDAAGWTSLGQALSRQLRYRDAIEAYTMALTLQPDDAAALRLRAGRYLTTLQTDAALCDFARCLQMGGDELDIRYRMGLCEYYAGHDVAAMAEFERCMPLCDDEMGIAAIYWHTLCAYRSQREPTLLGRYHLGMKVGHHTAYEKAVRVCADAMQAEEAMTALAQEQDDMDYAITAYGLCGYFRYNGQEELADDLLERILARDGFWPCFAYLAAWNDRKQDRTSAKANGEALQSYEAQQYASLESQLGNAPCLAEDTEEMFWLHQDDAFQSHVKLGNCLSKQFRFKEAAEQYAHALKIRSDDAMTYVRLGGTLLTLRQFDKALTAYRSALQCGANEHSVAFPMGIRHYLLGEYREAAQCFERCLPCGDEMAIAILYWHSLSCLRAGIEPTLLKQYRPDMQVGHHAAYKAVVALLCGETTRDAFVSSLEDVRSSLDYVIEMYGAAILCEHTGEQAKADDCLQKLLKKKEMWACVAYLAAWNDCGGSHNG